MKKNILLLSLCFCTLLSSANIIQKEIKDGWKFRQSRLTNWYPATKRLLMWLPLEVREPSGIS